MQEELLWLARFFFRAMGSPSPLPGIVLLDSLPGHQPSNANETNRGSNSLPGRSASLVEGFVFRLGGAERVCKSSS